jgi:hypothetical protein
MNVSIPSLATRAMLVYVSISSWSARKLDKKQTQKTIKGAGASSDAARVNKHLLANADSALKAIQRKANQIRDYIDANTLPWDDAGNRLISNDRALVVVGDIATLQTEFEAAIDDFIREYPVLRAQALANLGDMADDTDYPQPDQVRSKFKLSVSFNPLPEGFGDIRTGMSEVQAKAWQTHFEGAVKRQVNEALRAAYTRLAENLQRYSDRLRLKDDGSGAMERFRDTMVTSLRETLDLLASLNVFGDAELERLLHEIRTNIATHDAEALRASPTMAVLVKHEADEVLRRMQQFLV